MYLANNCQRMLSIVKESFPSDHWSHVTSGETCLETFNFQSVRTDCMFSIFLVMVVEEEEPTIRTTPFSPRPRLFWNQSDPLVAVEILCTNPDEF